MGSVTPVKPLGVLAMIDDGELDWKVRRRRFSFFFELSSFFSSAFSFFFFLTRAHDPKKISLTCTSKKPFIKTKQKTKDHLHQLGRPARRRGERRRGRRAVRENYFLFFSFSLFSSSSLSVSVSVSLCSLSLTHSLTHSLSFSLSLRPPRFQIPKTLQNPSFSSSASSRASSSASASGSATTRSRTASPRTSLGERVTYFFSSFF